MKGHLTAYERRFLAGHLFRGAKSQADREGCFDSLEALGMRDELFTLSVRGQLPPLISFVPPSKEEIAKDPAKVVEDAKAFEAQMVEVIQKLEDDLVPFDLEKPVLETILKGLGKLDDLGPMDAVVSARVGLRLRKVIAGDYAPPPLVAVDGKAG